MPSTIVSKAKGTRTCADCGSNLAAGATKCQNCGSTNIKKSLIIVRKEESVPDAPGQEAPDPEGFADAEAQSSDEEPDDATDDESEEDDPEFEEGDGEDDEDDLTEGDFEPADEEEDDESESDDDEEDDDVQKNSGRIAKSVQARAANDVALMFLTAADNICKALEDTDPMGAVDAEMTALNNAVDDALDGWVEGRSITKMSDATRQKLQAKLKMLKAKAAALKDPDDDGDDDTTPEGDTDHDFFPKKGSKMAKRSDIYKGLTPEAAEIVRKSHEVLEAAEDKKFEELAKSYAAPNSVELGKSLRFLSENNPDGFKAVEQALKAAQAAVDSSEVFKSFGLPGGQEQGVYGEAERLAKSFKEKDGVTDAVAFAKALETDPKLYDRMMAEGR